MDLDGYNFSTVEKLKVLSYILASITQLSKDVRLYMGKRGRRYKDLYHSSNGDNKNGLLVSIP